MKQTPLKTVLAAGIALVMPLAGYSQQQLGGTTADKKMQGNNSFGSTMGGLYTPSLFDGTANINIPIYQYSADGGNYGISLGYNTRGVKVDERAGEVGVHFQILAGSTIQRVAKDVPDDIYAELYPYIEPAAITLINPETKVRGRLVVYGETTAQAAEDSVYRDRESDDYIVSAGNLSFTFNLGKNGYVFTNPQRNARVELLYGGVPVTSLQSIDPLGMPEFRITDEQGNRYFFQVGDYRSESIKDKYGYQIDIGYYTYATSWVISKVITATGTEIIYKYSHNSHYASSKSYSDVQFDSQAPSGSIEDDPGHYARLDSIRYPNGITAWFKYDVINNRKDDYAEALREIRLISNGQTQLMYKMNQSYSVASGLPTNNPDYNATEIPYGGNGIPGTYPYYRLKLNSISIVGQTGPEEVFYNFEYSSVRLPKRFHGSQDYFGYYNGKTPVQYYSGGTNPDLDLSIPYHTPFSSGSAYGVNRDFDINYATAGIITKIKNTFGGQVEFQYGAHELANVLNSTNTPNLPTFSTDDAFLGETANDGLRLEAIIESDIFHMENYRKTLFTYVDGQRFLSGGYFDYPFMVDNTSHLPEKMTMTNQYVSRHQLVNGANHGYSYVTVKTLAENNHQLSRTVYTFSNFKDGSNAPKYQRVGAGSLYFFKFPFTEKQFIRDWEMGLPLSIKEYDQNDRITLETFNNYTFSIDSTSSAGKIENSRVAPVRTDYVPTSYTVQQVFDFTDSYRPFRGKAQLISSQTKKYISDNTYIDDAVTYKYDTHNNINYTLASNSKGEYFKTEQVYNYDLATLPGSGLQVFTDAGLEKVVSTQRWKTDASGNTYTRLMDGFISTFDYSNQQVKPKVMYTFIPGDAVSASMYAGGTGLSNSHGKIIQAFNGTVPDYFRKTSEVILSDAKGNPLESRLGDQNIFKSMIWDELTGQKLAEAASCHYADIAYCGFETPGTGTVTRGNVKYNASAVLSNSNSPVGSLYGSVFGLSAASGMIEGSQLLAAGKYVLSFWANGTPPTVHSGTTLLAPVAMDEYFGHKYYRVVFTAAANDKFKIEYSSGGTIYIDDVRLHPFTAQIENWSYTPMFGAGINTGVNGRPIFMLYDGQGRPKLVRDKNGNIISKTEYGIQ